MIIGKFENQANGRITGKLDALLVGSIALTFEPNSKGADYTVQTDLTAAAMLGALLQPPEIQYPLRVELPPYLRDYRATLLRHPVTQWAANIYRLHRGRSAQVSQRAAAR
jgi:hypothetical protein